MRRHLSRTDSLHYLFNCTCKTALDARQFVLALFFGHAPTEWLKLPSKTAQDARQFLGGGVFSFMYRPRETAQEARHVFAFFCGPLGSEVECFIVALSWPEGPVKFFAYVAPKGVMLFDSNVRFK